MYAKCLFEDRVETFLAESYNTKPERYLSFNDKPGLGNSWYYYTEFTVPSFVLNETKNLQEI